MLDRWDEVLVQHFIEGREVNVGILGDTVLPIAEIDFGNMPKGMWRIVTYRSKWEDGCDGGGVRPDAADDAGKAIPDPRYDVCWRRGGSFATNGATANGQACLACSTIGCPEAADFRKNRPHDVGLRCCLDF